MGRLTPRWRRYWGVRPGELRNPVKILGRGREMGEPVSGPHGRGWLRRHRPRRQRPGPAAREPEFPITLVADDDIPERVREHAVDIIARVARFAPRPVLHARVTLREHRDAALERPAVVKASLDVNGRSVRAHVAAGQLIEAIDLLDERLRRNLEDLDERTRARRRETGVAESGEWRHGDLPTARPGYFPRPREERELIRRKTLAPSPLSLAEATRELRLLDYDFYLFTNAETGEESVVYRLGEGGVALAERAPVLLVEDAVERLDSGGERFVFFADAQSRRGHVLYRRYDGHYGLLEPEPAG